MNKDRERCFELEEILKKERTKRINAEKMHAQDKEELLERCHNAEIRSLDDTNERIRIEENFNVMYNDNINLRNNLEIEKSNHASGLKIKSLLADTLQTIK